MTTAAQVNFTKCNSISKCNAGTGILKVHPEVCDSFLGEKKELLWSSECNKQITVAHNKPI